MDPADASACRLTGAVTFSGIGLYALYEANQQGAFAKVRPKGSPRGAPITAAIGVGE
jgi:predicted HAD superfamily Cof-like phosphohydrolase